jgi:para-aminobenzoate synthetase/4-amino-4-deoxychorismate lyase
MFSTTAASAALGYKWCKPAFPAALRYRRTRMQSRGRASFGIGAPEDAWRADLDSPLEIEQALVIHEVAPVVAWAERQAQAGRWVVLLLAYEAAPAFDASLVVDRGARAASAGGVSAPSVPLAWAACYERAVTSAAVTDREAGLLEPAPVMWAPTIDEARFTADLSRVLAHITAGDTYQVNYTFPLTAPFAHDPWPWFEACARQARVPYPACIDLGSSVVMSLSPELFVQRRGSRIAARPMKGTTRRGRWLDEDVRLSRALAGSDKARAENVMIVDLLRNDLGRVATIGSVRVSDLCALERYPTVWQLTSRIDATLRPGVDLWTLLGATFPCGSVTGAPKVRTMEIIAALESSPRGIYTGAICLLEPGGDFVASVPIRTAVYERERGTATFNVGAGITADSTAADEWAECLAKARVVRPAAVPEDARLFETLRLDAGVLVRRAGHVERLLASAALFDWPAPLSRIDEVLNEAVSGHAEGTWRVRLLLDRRGGVRSEIVPFTPEARPWRVAMAAAPIDTRSPLLFNKTTRREVYDQARGSAPEADDVLLWNVRGELTEATIANLVIEFDGQRVTPPVSCGLLPGVFRHELLTRGAIVERVVRVDDLARASRIWLVNSLREWIDAELVGHF